MVTNVTSVASPPSHCSSARQKMVDRPTSASEPNTVAPVVVKPDTASNSAAT